MRAIERTSRFKRDYRREKSGVLGKKLDQLLIEAMELLAADRPLPQRYFDHPLSGEWSGFRGIMYVASTTNTKLRPRRDAQKLPSCNDKNSCKLLPASQSPSFSGCKSVCVDHPHIGSTRCA
jgi:addiction module RelE/StbE family toxin